MRILALAPTSFFADYGCHVRIRGQLTALRARGHAVCLVTYPSGRDVDDLPIVRAPWPSPGPIQVGSSRLKLALDAVLGPTALAAALRFRPDVIHAYLHEGALIGAVLSTLLRRPLVFDFQGSLTGEMLDHRFISPRSPWLSPLRRLEGWIDRQPAAVLASSGHAARLLVEQFGVPAARITALPDSVDPDHFRPADAFDPAALATLRARLDIPAAARLIVYLGLLAPYQGTDLLLEAMTILARAQNDVHLLLMGFPFVERYRGQAAALGLAGRVTFTGAVPYEVAPIHLALGDVAVAPKLSATEGSGKLLTYMAAGLPVVAFDTAVHREYLGELGVYATAGDAGALAGALADVLDNRPGATVRGQALRKMAFSHTWEYTAISIETVYQGLQ
ncbi:MAG: glycosyltransferase family 4 protein [Chloroflexi bacterium]|nr:glycosyltransferase family 4 protein [Chloroflexota bacterium]